MESREETRGGGQSSAERAGRRHGAECAYARTVYVRDGVDEVVLIVVADADEFGVEREAAGTSGRPVHRRAVDVVAVRGVAGPAGWTRVRRGSGHEQSPSPPPCCRRSNSAWSS